MGGGNTRVSADKSEGKKEKVKKEHEENEEGKEKVKKDDDNTRYI